MAATMLAGMLAMTLACWMYTIAVALVRVRCILRERGEVAVPIGQTLR
jgi:heme exporter protein C